MQTVSKPKAEPRDEESPRNSDDSCTRNDIVSLKDLCSKDKKRIADLIRELAKLDLYKISYLM